MLARNRMFEPLKYILDGRAVRLSDDLVLLGDAAPNPVASPPCGECVAKGAVSDALPWADDRRVRALGPR